MSYAFVRAKVTRIDGNKVSPFSVRFGLRGKYEQGDVLTAEVVFEMRKLTATYCIIMRTACIYQRV